MSRGPMPTFGRAQDVRVAEATHKGYAAERVQPNGSRAQVLHGHIPHLAGGGGAASEGPWPESSPGPPGSPLTSNPAKWKASAISRSPLLPSSRMMATRGAGPPRGGVGVSLGQRATSAPQPPRHLVQGRTPRPGSRLLPKAHSAREAKPLHTLPHQARKVRMLWER